jgi:hypothetical protein
MAARESPRMVEEERERAESYSSCSGAHEVVQRPLVAESVRQLSFG